MTNTIQVLDLFSGMMGFHYARRNLAFNTICTSEIDPYCSKLIDQKFELDNAGDVRLINANRADHPHHQHIENDLVPVEQEGMTSLCIEDFYEDVLPWPDLICGGFPCQDVTSANTKAEGIKGKRSCLVDDQLDIIEDLEPAYCVFENAEELKSRGLSTIVARLSSLGYIVEWETISATAFGYPHYRHRVYLVAYRSDSGLARSGARVFEYVRSMAQENPVWNFPLIDAAPDYVKSFAVVENPKDIKLRTKRINALGNTIIPDIAEAIFKVIEFFEGLGNNLSCTPEVQASKSCFSHTIKGDSVLDHEGRPQTSLPTRGFASSGEVHTSERCLKLNPTKQTYEGLYSTLISKDGNNNYSCKSRSNRPGKLGGLIGELQKAFELETGGLDTQFAESFMGYPIGMTELPCHEELNRIKRVQAA